MVSTTVGPKHKALPLSYLPEEEAGRTLAEEGIRTRAGAAEEGTDVSWP